METWNQRLAQALAESALSPNKLATELKVSAPTVAAWIAAGNIKPAQDITANNLFKACALLGVRPQWVLFRQLPKKADESLSESAKNDEPSVYPDTDENPYEVKGMASATAERIKKEIITALADGGLSNELLTAIYYMIRAGMHSPVRGDQHHTKTVKLKHARPTARRVTGTG